MKKFVLTGLGIAALTGGLWALAPQSAAILSAAAETAPSAAQKETGMFHRAHGWGHARWGSHDPAERAEKLIDYLNEDWEITAEQEPAFDALSDALRGFVGEMGALRQAVAEGGDDAAISAPDRLAEFEAGARDGLAAFGVVTARFGALYDIMDERQKRRADRLLARRGFH